LLKFGILNELYVYVYFEIENEAPLVNKHTSILNMESRRHDFCKSGSAIPNMTFSTRNVDPLTIGVIHEEVCQLLVKTRQDKTALSPKFPSLAIQILLFRLKHTVAVVTLTHAHVLQIFYTTWVRGVACQKQRLGPKLAGVWARGASKKIGTPCSFLQNLPYPIDLAGRH